MGRTRDDDTSRGLGHLDRGWEFAMEGDLDEARRSAERARENEGDTPEVHTLFGYIHQLEGQLDDALRSYRSALRFDPLYLDAMIRAVEVLYLLGRRDDADELAEEALELCETPDERADVLLLRIESALDAGDVEGAAQRVRDLPEGPFESPHMPFLIGRARFEVGDLDGAEASLVDARERDPGSPDVHYYLGLVHEQRRREREATLAFLRSLKAERDLAPPPGSLTPELFEKRVRAAMRRLPPAISARLDEALVVPCDLPGMEVVAEGVDPRVPLLVDDEATEGGARRIVRLFLYQRNLERFVGPTGSLVDEIVHAIEREVSLVFPET